MSTSLFTKVVHRQLLLAFRRPAALLNPLTFYAVVIALMPLGLGPERQVLADFAPGLLWIAALLASLLSAETLLRSDYDDGSLEQIVASGGSVYLGALGYVISHWLITGLPLMLLVPLFSQLLSMPTEGVLALVASIGVGTLLLSALGTLGAALTVALRRGGMLISLLLLPLEVPVLILGAGLVERAISGLAIQGLLSILIGLAVLAVTLVPIAIAASIRISLEV